MTTDDDEQKALDVLRSVAGLIPLNLTVERQLTELVGKISLESWERAFNKFPNWFDLYFGAPLEMFERMRQLKSVQDGVSAVESGSDLTELFQKSVDNIWAAAREAGAVHRDISKREEAVSLDIDEMEAQEVLEELAVYRSIAAEIRARCFYGQGMHSLIAAGLGGNDKGYVLAVSIDPTVQWHPALRERVVSEAAAGRTGFADKLRKAAELGPSPRIDKDLHQLRYMLGLFEELGALKESSDAERYELFCLTLGLYPNTGENPKAALCTFIKRWRSSLVR